MWNLVLILVVAFGIPARAGDYEFFERPNSENELEDFVSDEVNDLIYFDSTLLKSVGDSSVIGAGEKDRYIEEDLLELDDAGKDEQDKNSKKIENENLWDSISSLNDLSSNEEKEEGPILLEGNVSELLSDVPSLEEAPL